MTKYYIMITGLSDSIFVGPFATKEAADTYSSTREAQFDNWTMTEEEMRININEFGECPIEQP